MSSQHNKLSRKRKVFNFKVFPMKNEGIDTSIDTDENALDTLDSINQKFERNTSNEIPKNNSWVNYEDEHDIEEIFYTPSETNSDDFKGFNVKEVAGIKQYTDKFIKYNMLQNIEDKEEIEVITIDSDIEVDLDFDLDFSGFKSKEVIKFKDYNDKFTNMLRKSKKENSEGEEYSDFSFEEEEIDSFGFLEEFGYDMDNISHLETPTENVEDLDFSDNNNEEVEEEIEEDEDMGGQDMDSDLWNNEDELPHIQVINWDSPDFNVDNMWKNTFYFSKEDGGFRTFRCKKENCSSFIIVFEDEKERQFLYEVKDCKNHEIPYQSQKKP